MADEIPVSQRIDAVVELFNEYTGTRDERTLARAMTEITAIVDGPADEDDRIAAHGVLGFVAWEVYQLTHDRAALDASVTGSRTALAVLPAEHPQRPHTLSNLAGALGSLFDDFGDVETIRAAAGHMREAVELTRPAPTSTRPSRWRPRSRPAPVRSRPSTTSGSRCRPGTASPVPPRTPPPRSTPWIERSAVRPPAIRTGRACCRTSPASTPGATRRPAIRTIWTRRSGTRTRPSQPSRPTMPTMRPT